MLRNFTNKLREIFILAPLLIIVSILTLPKKVYWKMKKRKDIIVRWQRERAAYYHLPLSVQNTQVGLTYFSIFAIGFFCLGKFVLEPLMNPQILQNGGEPLNFNGVESLVVFDFLVLNNAFVNLIDDDDDNLVIYERSKTRYITQIKSLFSKKHQFSFENWRFQEEWNDTVQFPHLILYLAPFSQKSRVLKDSGPHLSLQHKKMKSICKILENQEGLLNLPQFPKELAELIAEYTLNPASLHLARNANYYPSETTIRGPEALADIASRIFPINKDVKEVKEVKENMYALSHIITMPAETEFEFEIDIEDEKRPLLKEPGKGKP